MNVKTKQLYLSNLSYPFESVSKVLFEKESIIKIFTNSEYKVKLFIGSDWSIKNSGFGFYGPNGLSIVFVIKNVIENDFLRQNSFSITQINGIDINIEAEEEFSIIKNTCDNTCIMEARINYNSDKDIDILENYIKLSYIKEAVNKIFAKIKILFNQPSNEEKFPEIKLNHSFVIKKNYKDAFDFYYNLNNLAKTLKTDKIWKIVSEENYIKDNQEYKDYSIITNNNVKIFYRVISIKEIKDEKIEIVYEKSGKNHALALNHYIKFTFFNIDKNLSFFLYETHLPSNIISSIYQIISHYLFYCNYQSRKYIESI